MLHPNAPQGIVEFRVISNEDDAFLFRLYASTRAEEMATVAWSDAEKDRFLRGQFEAQTQGYATTNLMAIHRIIQLDKVDIGRMIVDRQDDCLRLIDLSLLPEYRGRGLGTDLLRSLMNEAHGGKVPMRLFALKQGRALNLYLRHGFRPIGEVQHRYELEWMPDTGPREI